MIALHSDKTQSGNMEISKADFQNILDSNLINKTTENPKQIFKILKRLNRDRNKPVKEKISKIEELFKMLNADSDSIPEYYKIRSEEERFIKIKSVLNQVKSIKEIKEVKEVIKKPSARQTHIDDLIKVCILFLMIVVITL